MGTTEIFLTFLTATNGVLAIFTFMSNRKKDTSQDGEKAGQLQSDLLYIKSVLLDVRAETKETNKLIDSHNERITRLEESHKQLLNRLKELEERMRLK